MPRTLDESLAFRRELSIGVLVFVLTFLAILIALELIFFRLIIAEQAWWGIPQALFHGITISFVMAGGLTIAVVRPLQWWHHRKGIYRCYRCGGPMPLNGFCPCVIAADEVLARRVALHERLPVRGWRHVRQQLRRRVLPIALVLIVPSICIALNLPERNPDPLWVKLVYTYGGLNAMLGFIGIAVLEFFAWRKIGRRMRIRYDLVLRIIGVMGALVLFTAAFRQR